MKKHTIADFSVLNNGRNNLFSKLRKNATLKKLRKYIYTEKDLGEGLLDAGVPDNYRVGKLQFN